MIVVKVARILSSRRAIFSLTFILLLTSAAFCFTSSILLSVDNTAAGMLGESSDTIVVAQANSRAPFLGTLPLNLAASVEGVDGVAVVSPEVFAPSILWGRPVMARGVEPGPFMELQNPSIIEGSPLSGNDTSQAMVGETLAAEDDLHPGSEITLTSGVRATIAQLEVKGVFSTGTPLDNEVVVPLVVGEWLRGVDYGVISILRVGVGAQENVGSVSLSVGKVVQSTLGTGQGSNAGAFGEGLPVSSDVVSFAGHLVEASPQVSSSFFSKTVGLSQENILLISALVFVSMAVAIVCALQDAVFRSRNELGALRTIGMSSRRLSSNLVLVATSLAFGASVLGLAAGWGFLTLVADFSPVQIAFYAVDPRSAFAPASLYTVAVVTAAGFAAALVASVRFKQRLGGHAMTIEYVESEPGGLNE